METRIAGYPNYTIGTDGVITSHLYKPKVLKGRKCKRGYVSVVLSRGAGASYQQYQFKVHRLVALHYLPNPSGLSEVNHIDGDKGNNSVSNLEWCSRVANMKHAVSSGLHDMVKAMGVTYTVTSPDGTRVTFTGLNKFCRDNGLHPSPLKEVIDGKRKQHKGWRA